MPETSRRPLYFLFFILLSACFSAVPPLSAQRVNIEAIKRAGQKPIRLAVESSDPQYRGLVQQAFALHGGFEVAAPASADWILSVNVSANTVQYIAKAKSGDLVKSQGTASASTPFDALRKALDAVVGDFTGRSGFYQGTLAFVAEPTGRPEIYTADILFRSVVPVTSFKSNVVSPRWSPDGKRLIYTTYAQTGYPDIVVQDLDKKSLITVANYKGVNLGGRFSPDGKRMAFVASSSGSPEIYVARPDGSSARRQTWTKGLAATPTWSPDVRNIVFVSDDWGGPQLILLDLEKKANTRIKTGMGGYNVEPAWNHAEPDLIAFTARRGSGFQLALYSFSTRESVWLTEQPGSCVEPAWLSDGRHIAFTYRYRGTKQLKVLDTLTGHIASLHSKQLPNASQADYSPVMR